MRSDPGPGEKNLSRKELLIKNKNHLGIISSLKSKENI